MLRRTTLQTRELNSTNKISRHKNAELELINFMFCLCSTMADVTTIADDTQLSCSDCTKEIVENL